MCKTPASQVILIATLCCAFSAACSSGGGAGGTASTFATVASPPGSQTASNGSSSSSSSNSGSGGSGSGTASNSFGPPAAPTPGSFGDSPLPPQIATTTGPTFDGTSGTRPANVSFPVLSSTLQFDSGAAVPVTSGQSASATISADSSTVHLVVPSANLDQSLPLTGTPALPTPYGWDLSILKSMVNTDDVSSWGLSYVSLGLWLHSGAMGSSPQVAFTAYTFGYETPAAGMPMSGTAAYSGPGAVRGEQTLGSGGCGDCVQWISGDSSFSVNFASGNINGGFTNMSVHGDSGVFPFYNISVGGQIASGTNKFSGTTTISAQQSAGVGTANGSGVINGAFYGPNAQNLGAIWTLTSPNFSILGAVGAAHQ